MRNLDVRRAHWDDPKNRAPREEHDLEDSLPYPFEGMSYMFADKDVLEVGPGRGRQYDYLKDVVRSYSVCDISPAALAEPALSRTVGKYLLCDYKYDFGVRFDVVHFWYVLHHILPEEMDHFFEFVARHLRAGGLAVFNSPQSGHTNGWYTDDGLGTTWMDHGIVRGAYSPYFDTLDVYCQDERSSGDLFVVRKI